MAGSQIPIAQINELFTLFLYVCLLASQPHCTPQLLAHSLFRFQSRRRHRTNQPQPMAQTQAKEPQEPKSEQEQGQPTLPKIVIRQFQEEDRAAVRAIFVDGFPVHTGEVVEAADAYVKSSLETDLADIAGVYINTGGNFWVATMENSEGEPQVVGMVALEKKENADGELRRMSVKREFRRYGVGKLLVVVLEQWAKANGYKTISLWTGEVMKVAHKFYAAIGYKKKSERAIPEDPNFFIYEFVKQL